MHVLRSIVDATLRPFDALPATLALVVVSILTGVAMLFVVRYATRQRAVARARDRMTSAIYEIRLYLDQPRQVLAAQGRFLVASGVYLVQMIPALIVMIAPLGLLFLHLETRFGLAPLDPREPIVVRIDLADGIAGETVAVTGEGATLTTAPVYDRARQRLYARISLQGPADATLRVTTPEAEVSKRLVGDPRARRVSPERSEGLAALWSFGHEAPLPAGAGIENIRVPHETSPRTWLWMPWWLFWLMIATVAALLLRRPLRVAL